MTDRDKMTSEIGASLIRDISCQSCADLRAERDCLRSELQIEQGRFESAVAMCNDLEIERDELRANRDRLRGVVEMFEARGQRTPAEDVGRRIRVPCPGCGGSGVRPGRPCEDCDGTGDRFVPFQPGSGEGEG